MFVPGRHDAGLGPRLVECLPGFDHLDLLEAVFNQDRYFHSRDFPLFDSFVIELLLTVDSPALSCCLVQGLRHGVRIENKLFRRSLVELGVRFSSLFQGNHRDIQVLARVNSVV